MNHLGQFGVKVSGPIKHLKKFAVPCNSKELVKGVESTSPSFL